MQKTKMGLINSLKIIETEHHKMVMNIPADNVEVNIIYVSVMVITTSTTVKVTGDNIWNVKAQVQSNNK